MRHEIGVGDQHPRRVGMRAEDADRLAGLHAAASRRLERPQRRDDAVEALPVARGAADAAIDHELAAASRRPRVEVVHQHAQRRFGQPALALSVGAVRRADGAGVIETSGHRYPSTAGKCKQVSAPLAMFSEWVWRIPGPSAADRSRREDSRAVRAPSAPRGRRLSGLPYVRVIQPPLKRPFRICGHRLAAQIDATLSAKAGSHDRPSLVPMLKTGSSPGNNRGMTERIE